MDNEYSAHSNNASVWLRTSGALCVFAVGTARSNGTIKSMCRLIIALVPCAFLECFDRNLLGPVRAFGWISMQSIGRKMPSVR